MSINKNELTKEMFEKAVHCETGEELIALAKEEGIDLTKEEAEAYLAEMDDMELDDEALKKVSGGYGPACINHVSSARGDEREDMEPGMIPAAFMRGEITGGEDF